MNIQPFDIEMINRELLNQFGKLHDKQKFRVVWSDDQIEYRKVNFINGVHLIYPKVEEIKKYSYIKERWLLEVWTPHVPYEDVISLDGGTYEAVWTFQDKAGNPLRPIWKACEILALAAEGRFFSRRTEADDVRDRDAEIEADVKIFEEMLEPTVDYGNQKANFVKPVYLGRGNE